MDKINYTDEDLLDHHGVAAVIKNNQGEILMQEHVKYGFWTIPVGKVKHNQSVVEGLKEEILEECNLKLDKITEIANKKYSYLRNEKDVSVDVHLFDVATYSGEMKNNEPHKHKNQEFMTLEKIKTLPYLSDITLLYLETIGFKRLAKI